MAKGSPTYYVLKGTNGEGYFSFTRNEFVPRKASATKITQTKMLADVKKNPGNKDLYERFHDSYY